MYTKFNMYVHELFVNDTNDLVEAGAWEVDYIPRLHHLRDFDDVLQTVSQNHSVAKENIAPVMKIPIQGDNYSGMYNKQMENKNRS